MRTPERMEQARLPRAESSGKGDLGVVTFRQGFSAGLRALAAFVVMAAFGRAEAQAWSLLWSDEFNGAARSAPDPAVWGYDTGGGGFGNGEVEVYCAPGSGAAPCDARRPNLYLDGEGHLVIHAVRTDGVWTSGRTKTEGKKSFLYGRVEARMRWGIGDGFWPAFWMLGENIGRVGWPAAGEQDIMEWVQKYGPGKTSSTVHGPGYSGGQGISGTFAFPHGGRADDAFHTYGVVWSENRLAFYRDNPGQPYLTVTPKDLPPGAAWVYDRPFFLLLNFAIGGPTSGFSGPTDATTPPEGTMLVDYVRVWTSATGTDAGRRYTVQSATSGTCVSAAAGGGARQAACAAGQPAQAWTFTPLGKGYDRVVSAGGSQASFLPGEEAWLPVAMGENRIELVGRRDGRCLDIAAGGNGLGESECRGTAAQLFVLTQEP